MNVREASYRRCARIVADAHSNFTAAFRFLPREEARAMIVLYAFMRSADDLVDSAGSVEFRAENLQKFANLCEFALNSELPSNDDSVFPALREVVQKYGIPYSLFRDFLDGMKSDLVTHFYPTRANLEQYSYRVASAVGLICLHIWGVPARELVTGTEVFRAADACGKALQWTNILRDLREDAQNGRVYLPLEDFPEKCASFESVQAAILGKDAATLEPVIRTNLEVAREYYARARGVEGFIPRRNRKVFRLITRTYFKIFEKIEKNPEIVLTQRIKLSKLEKILLLFV